MESKKWSMSEIDILIDNFPNKRSDDISKMLNRSKSSIICKANKLGLKKSKDHVSKLKSDYNKIKGRDLNYDSLSQIASAYSSRSEFQISDGSAYQTARRLNILDDICSHMIKQSFSIPQMILKYILKEILNSNCLYDSRKIISPYELDIYFPEFKLAFEYNGRWWHKNDTIDKSEMCTKKDIKLFTIVENSRRYEDDIKYQISKILNEIEIITNKSIPKSNLFEINIPKSIFDDVIDENYIKQTCDRYNDFTLFVNENSGLYYKMIKLSILEKYTSHMKKRKIWTDEMAMREVEKYEYLSDMLKNSYGCYLWLKKNKKEYIMSALKLKQNKKLKFNDKW